MSDTPRTDAASVSREYIEREMDRYTQKFVLAGHMSDLERELAEAKRNYMELIMAVGNVCPNETRHQTALRYIKEREAPSTDQSKCSAMKEGK